MSDTEEQFILLASNDKNCKELVNKDKYPQLENVNWTINVTAANEKEQSIMEPHALIRLKLVDKVSNSSSITILDYNEGECIKFYDLLENIQSKLDDIYKE